MASSATAARNTSRPRAAPIARRGPPAARFAGRPARRAAHRRPRARSRDSQTGVTCASRRCAPPASGCRGALVRRGPAGDARRRPLDPEPGRRAPVPRGLGLQHAGTARVRGVAPSRAPAVARGLDGALRRLARLKSPAPALLSDPLEDCRTEGTVIKSLLVGAIAGGAVMWIYGDRIRDYIDDMTMNVRERAAAGLEGAAERLQTVADTVEDGLSGAARRAS